MGVTISGPIALLFPGQGVQRPGPVLPRLLSDGRQLAQVMGVAQAMLTAVEAGDPDAFFESIARDGDRRRVCGLSPIYTALQLLRREGKVLKYGQAPDPNGTVTFASVVF